MKDETVNKGMRWTAKHFKTTPLLGGLRTRMIIPILQVLEESSGSNLFTRLRSLES